MFDRIEYSVMRIDGDYAYLQRSDMSELKCVARALLPPEVNEGDKVAYEMLSYEIA